MYYYSDESASDSPYRDTVIIQSEFDDNNNNYDKLRHRRPHPYSEYYGSTSTPVDSWRRDNKPIFEDSGDSGFKSDLWSDISSPILDAKRTWKRRSSALFDSSATADVLQKLLPLLFGVVVLSSAVFSVQIVIGNDLKRSINGTLNGKYRSIAFAHGRVTAPDRPAIMDENGNALGGKKASIQFSHDVKRADRAAKRKERKNDFIKRRNDLLSGFGETSKPAKEKEVSPLDFDEIFADLAPENKVNEKEPESENIERDFETAKSNEKAPKSENKDSETDPTAIDATTVSGPEDQAASTESALEAATDPTKAVSNSESKIETKTRADPTDTKNTPEPSSDEDDEASVTEVRTESTETEIVTNDNEISGLLEDKTVSKSKSESDSLVEMTPKVDSESD